jgi:hypothetical protein
MDGHPALEVSMRSALCSLVLVYLVLTPGIRGASAVTMASGHTVRGATGAELTSSFSAVLSSTGEATGRARIASEAAGLSFVLELNCLVVSGGLAKIGGEVIQSDSPALIGSNVVFHVEDNGTTPADPPDRASSAFITGTRLCDVHHSGWPSGIAHADQPGRDSCRRVVFALAWVTPLTRLVRADQAAS